MEKHKNQRFCVPKRVQNSHLDNAGMMSSVPGKLTWGFKVRTTKKSAFAEDLKKKVKASGACSAQFAVGVPRPTSKDPRIPAEPVCAGQPGHSQSRLPRQRSERSSALPVLGMTSRRAAGTWSCPRAKGSCWDGCWIPNPRDLGAVTCPGTRALLSHGNDPMGCVSARLGAAATPSSPGAQVPNGTEELNG